MKQTSSKSEIVGTEAPKYQEFAEKVSLTINGISGSKFIEQEMAMLMLEVFETFKMKQASYGPHNIGKFGERGVFIRCNDKIERLKRMVWDDLDDTIPDESIEDTWMDLADYALIALLVRSGAWAKI